MEMFFDNGRKSCKKDFSENGNFYQQVVELSTDSIWKKLLAVYNK